jgi:CRP/FNR family cyclic AMP-dependent transcriptional regulator
MSAIDEARDLVSRLGWLSYVPQRFRRQVLDRCLLEDVEAGVTVYNVGDPPGGMFGLVSGGLGVSVAPGERGPYIAHFARPGTWFGEAAAITGQPRRIGLAATRPTRLLHLPLHAIHEIVRQDPAAWRYIALVSVAHNDTAIGASDDLMIRDTEKRFVAVLLRLGGCRLSTGPSSVPIEVDVTQEDLAAMANVTRNTAGAILRRLADRGQLALHYRKIGIVEPDALRALLAD